MDVGARDRLRTKLLALRDEIVAGGDVRIEPGRTDAVEKRDEDAAPLSEMGQVIASSRNRERTRVLHGIEDALQRMADTPDEFGMCEDCGEDIPVRRLELMPWVRLCIACQGAREDGGPGAKGRKHITDFR